MLRAGGHDAPLEEPHRRVDTRALLCASVDSFAPAASAGDVALVLDPGPDAPIMADAFRLRQVFDNLVSNGVK